MSQLSAKADEKIAVSDEYNQQFDHIDGRRPQVPANSMDGISEKQGRGQKTDEEVRHVLKDMTEEILSQFSEMDAETSQIMLSQFVSDLFLGLAQKRQKEERRVKQSEGIAEAKERGVRFGRSRKPLPDNFREYHEAWRGGQMSLREAAKACGMSHATFRNAAMRIESMG